MLGRPIAPLCSAPAERDHPTDARKRDPESLAPSLLTPPYDIRPRASSRDAWSPRVRTCTKWHPPVADGQVPGW